MEKHILTLHDDPLVLLILTWGMKKIQSFRKKKKSPKRTAEKINFHAKHFLYIAMNTIYIFFFSSAICDL